MVRINQSMLLDVILSHIMINLIKDRQPKIPGSESDVAINITQILGNQTEKPVEWDQSNLFELKKFGTTGNLKRAYRKVS